MKNSAYVSFADESYSEKGFNSIASFSLRKESLPEVNSRLQDLLRASSVSEFKWKKLKTAQYRMCALKLIDFVLTCIQRHNARVDVLIWDINDSRHKIRQRDDTANYERMFYHLHASALKRRPISSTWELYPDEGVGINWEIVAQCLDARGQQKPPDMPLFSDFYRDPHYKIEACREIKSHETPCCQIADLFAGLSIFSRTHYDKYEAWCQANTPELFSSHEKEKAKLSNTERERFEVLKHFDVKCKAKMLGVSLKTTQRLETRNPKNPINFWPYTPQHEMDKAPTRNGR